MADPNFTQSGTAAQARTMSDKFHESVSVLDFIPLAEHADIAAGTSTYDCHAAIVAAIASRTFGPWDPGPSVAAPAIYFPSGVYPCGQTIQLKKSVRLHGDGSGVSGQSTARLKFPAGVGGIVVNRHNTEGDTPSPPSTTAADGTIIEGLQIVGTRLGATTHGIRLLARALVRNCFVTEFSGNGIHVEATSDASNANNFRVEGGRVAFCTGHGLYTNGADANAGYVVALDSSHNGGVGIYDSSFLGNTYVACHTEHNEVCGYKADGSQANNVFVGCYDELSSISGACQLYAPAYIVGGSLLNGNTGDAIKVLSTERVSYGIPPVPPAAHSPYIAVGKNAGSVPAALLAFGSNEFGGDFRCNRPNDDALPFSANSRCVLGMHGRPRSYWIPLVAAVERGANLHVVAERHGVNPSTLAWWRTVLRREQRAEVPALLPLVLDAAVPRDAAVSHDGTVEVLVDGATLRVAVGTDVKYVAALARALVRSC